MKIKSQLTLVAVLLVCISVNFISCEYIEAPYTEDVVVQPIDSNDTLIRKVLLEDYTGHKCPNCPSAAKTADTITNYLFKGRVITIAAHVSSSFASPNPGLFSNDYRTAEGTDWDNYFLISQSGLPKGMVNRIDFPTLQHKKSPTAWISLVATEVQKPVEANIEIDNEFNQTTNSVTAVVKSKFLVNKTGKFYLNVVYIEDSVISAQLYPSNQVDSFYVHEHMLRGTLNGTWGEQIALDPSANFEKSKTYSVVIRADAVVKNCRVVAFIYNNDTKEVVQAEEESIQ